ncbi:MAG: ATP synthase F1 subunit gamma [Tannerella sp.]|jgi:F-type H+-transporting ATPase subunit gamma|nr:ATP synthase F1 subunit gamma [Tannerella sp.]
MAIFKEIKKRINSVASTRKTTSAMKLVSSAKLRKAEGLITNMLPYAEAMKRIMGAVQNVETSGQVETLHATSPHATSPAQNAAASVALIIFASDSSLCGAFNANIIREALKIIDLYRQTIPDDNISIYTIGKKSYDALRKSGVKITKNFENLAAKPDYNTISSFGDELLQMFNSGSKSQVELLYHHYRSVGSQELIRQTLLPYTSDIQVQKQQTDYIHEPSHEELLKTLIPKSIKLQLYTALLDSNASEHAARMLAMQTATDNADDLIADLTLEYNKSRQQAITNELLDLASGKN